MMRADKPTTQSKSGALPPKAAPSRAGANSKASTCRKSAHAEHAAQPALERAGPQPAGSRRMASSSNAASGSRNRASGNSSALLGRQGAEGTSKRKAEAPKRRTHHQEMAPHVLGVLRRPSAAEAQRSTSSRAATQGVPGGRVAAGPARPARGSNIGVGIGLTKPQPSTGRTRLSLSSDSEPESDFVPPTTVKKKNPAGREGPEQGRRLEYAPLPGVNSPRKPLEERFQEVAAQNGGAGATEKSKFVPGWLVPKGRTRAQPQRAAGDVRPPLHPRNQATRGEYEAQLSASPEKPAAAPAPEAGFCLSPNPAKLPSVSVVPCTPGDEGVEVSSRSIQDVTLPEAAPAEDLRLVAEEPQETAEDVPCIAEEAEGAQMPAAEDMPCIAEPLQQAVDAYAGPFSPNPQPAVATRAAIARRAADASCVQQEHLPLINKMAEDSKQPAAGPVPKQARKTTSGATKMLVPTKKGPARSTKAVDEERKLALPRAATAVQNFAVAPNQRMTRARVAVKELELQASSLATRTGTTTASGPVALSKRHEGGSSASPDIEQRTCAEPQTASADCSALPASNPTVTCAQRIGPAAEQPKPASSSLDRETGTIAESEPIAASTIGQEAVAATWPAGFRGVRSEPKPSSLPTASGPGAESEPTTLSSSGQEGDKAARPVKKQKTRTEPKAQTDEGSEPAAVNRGGTCKPRADPANKPPKPDVSNSNCSEEEAPSARGRVTRAQSAARKGAHQSSAGGTRRSQRRRAQTVQEDHAAEQTEPSRHAAGVKRAVEVSPEMQDKLDPPKKRCRTINSEPCAASPAPGIADELPAIPEVAEEEEAALLLVQNSEAAPPISLGTAQAAASLVDMQRSSSVEPPPTRRQGFRRRAWQTPAPMTFSKAPRRQSRAQASQEPARRSARQRRAPQQYDDLE